jgi:hypothetical protein
VTLRQFTRAQIRNCSAMKRGPASLLFPLTLEAGIFFGDELLELAPRVKNNPRSDYDARNARNAARSIAAKRRDSFSEILRSQSWAKANFAEPRNRCRTERHATASI